jgi:hypothetical protein
VAVSLLALAARAAAVPLPPSGSPLPGSSFQGADGNQSDSSALLDWQGLHAAGRVHHNPDPDAHDSAFVGGSKENDPGNWDFETVAGGVSPGKSNILDAWAGVDQPASDTFLYLAFRRADAGGTTNVAFELNRDARLWNNGKAMVPCRRDGDIVIA